MTKQIDYEKLYAIYEQGEETELSLYIQSAAVQRLKHVGMNCGLEYTDFPFFRKIGSYSRFSHSLGVAKIIFHFSKDRKMALSGLFHDISTPAFSHVVDFMNGDALHQESTESGTEAVIANDPAVMRQLQKEGILLSEVSDYHRYPIADNDSPKLSSDRLEYTFGNIIQFELGTFEDIQNMYEDLVLGNNEEGQPEIMFCHRETAALFAHHALTLGRIYASCEDRYAMARLAGLLKDAAEKGILSNADLMRDEPHVIALLEKSCLFQEWHRFQEMNMLLTRNEKPEEPGWLTTVTKKRYIDPYVIDTGRVTEFDLSFQKELTSFLEEGQDIWMKGVKK